jgi:hypothetical protein
VTGPAAAPYEALAQLGELELELIGEGRVEELPELWQARDALLATLPQTPPPAARAALERCALMQKRIRIEIVRCQEEVLRELAKVHRAQRMARAYGAGGRRGPRFSASA